MIRTKNVCSIIGKNKVSYEVDIELPNEIDTSECEDSGIRCPPNIHVTEKKRSHRDRVGPRFYAVDHLREDVGITSGSNLSSILFISLYYHRYKEPHPRSCFG